MNITYLIRELKAGEWVVWERDGRKYIQHPEKHSTKGRAERWITLDAMSRRADRYEWKVETLKQKKDS